MFYYNVKTDSERSAGGSLYTNIKTNRILNSEFYLFEGMCLGPVSPASLFTTNQIYVLLVKFLLYVGFLHKIKIFYAAVIFCRFFIDSNLLSCIFSKSLVTLTPFHTIRMNDSLVSTLPSVHSFHVGIYDKAFKPTMMS